MPEIVDDKSTYVVPFILECLEEHRSEHNGSEAPPLFIGLNGIQGAGKTTLVSALRETLTSPPHNLPLVVLSIDDLYLAHNDQVSLAQSHQDNPLVQHRGEPSTHDLSLGYSLFTALKARRPTKIPVYNKSAYAGAGDRAPSSTFHRVNDTGEPSISVVIFEGWCVGFRALNSSALRAKYEAAAKEARQADEQGKRYNGRLGKHELQHLEFVNEALKKYDVLTDELNAFVHIDAEEIKWVYKWRAEQERNMRAEKGAGMSDEKVIEFVNGYYPAYELYTDTLRKGIFNRRGRHLRLVVGEDRKVSRIERL